MGSNWGLVEGELLLSGIDPSRLSAAQMASVVYVLLLRDHGSSVNREKLDRILAGEIVLPEVSSPDFDAMGIAPPWGNREPTRADMDKLRDSWGAPQSSQGRKAALDQFLSNLPPSSPPRRRRGQ